jgi:hypothetical protein
LITLQVCTGALVAENARRADTVGNLSPFLRFTVSPVRSEGTNVTLRQFSQPRFLIPDSVAGIADLQFLQ